MSTRPVILNIPFSIGPEFPYQCVPILYMYKVAYHVKCWYIVTFKVLVLLCVSCLSIHILNKLYVHLLQPYLSVMLNKGTLEVLVYVGSNGLRRVVRRPDQGVLNDGREHSLRIERLPSRLVFVFLCSVVLLVALQASRCGHTRHDYFRLFIN